MIPDIAVATAVTALIAAGNGVALMILALYLLLDDPDTYNGGGLW